VNRKGARRAFVGQFAHIRDNSPAFVPVERRAFTVSRMLALPLYDDSPKTRPPVVTVALIATCAVVFYWQAGLGAKAATAASFRYGMVPAVLFGYAELPARLHAVPAAATLITSMFLHGGILHLLGNMLYLWIFGKGVESALGPTRFLVLYLLCGTVAALTQALTDPTADVPMIGASGAIAGILGAYLILQPRSNVVVLLWIIVFIRLVTLPAVILLGIWFALQLLSALSMQPGEAGVAFWAHVGGFLAGMALVLILRPPGVSVLQPRRTASFAVARARSGGRRFGAGSVPRAGRRNSPRGWD
jgi:membrane associated rhomboid family serine protease